VALHGISINFHPCLSHFTGIVPCGISDAGATSLKNLGSAVSMAELDGDLENGLSDFFQVATNVLAFEVCVLQNLMR
jgi:lipoyl(octanoyl) transferase